MKMYYLQSTIFSLLTSNACYIHQEFSLLTHTDLHYLVWGYLQSRFARNSPILTYTHFFSFFCLQMLIAPDTFQPNPSCRQYFISYLEGLLIDIYFCTETKSVVQHHIIKGNQPPLGSSFCLPLKKKVPSKLFHRYAF